MPGSLGLFLEIILLSVYGTFVIKLPWKEAWLSSLLLRSVFGVADSVSRWADYQIFIPLIMKSGVFFYSADAVRELGKILLVIVFLTIILRCFYRNRAGVGKEQLLLLMAPLFFIALVERVMQDTFYSGTITVDTITRTVSADKKVSHGDNLLLQLLAGVCLIVILLIHQRLARMQLAEKKLFYLSEQAAEQKRYLEEAILREKQTCAFRHDFQNHLTVLKELLRTEQTEKAGDYLNELAESAEGLFSTVRTGNAAVDVLLGSKCAIAKQKGISVSCELMIPKESKIRDIDWCILFSNAFDNAVAACEMVSPEKRYFRLSETRKGNFYLLFLENSCDEKIRELPPEGIGLSNMRAVLESAGGTMEKSVSGGIYKLKLLFVLPQQKKECLHQLAEQGRSFADN